jgi:hypothetical protein
MRDEHQLVEPGEDQAAADGVEHLAVDLRGEGDGAGPPARLAHVVRGRSERKQRGVEHLGLLRGALHAPHGGVGIDAQRHVVAVLLQASDRDHHGVVPRLQVRGHVGPGKLQQVVLLQTRHACFSFSFSPSRVARPGGVLENLFRISFYERHCFSYIIPFLSILLREGSS